MLYIYYLPPPPLQAPPESLHLRYTYDNKQQIQLTIRMQEPISLSLMVYQVRLGRHEKGVIHEQL